MRKNIKAVTEVFPVFKRDSVELLRDLSYLRTTIQRFSSIQLSSYGLITIPEELRAEIHPSSFTWLRPSNNSLGSYQYDLWRAEIDDVPRLRLAIAKLCQRTSTDMVSASLYTICSFWQYAEGVTAIDDNLIVKQEGWIAQRLELIRRHEYQIGADSTIVVDFLVNIIQDAALATPLPTYHP